MHICPLDRDCRRSLKGIGGPCWRGYLFTKRWDVGVALRPSDRFIGKMNSKYKWFYVERKT